MSPTICYCSVARSRHMMSMPLTSCIEVRYTMSICGTCMRTRSKPTTQSKVGTTSSSVTLVGATRMYTNLWTSFAKSRLPPRRPFSRTFYGLPHHRSVSNTESWTAVLSECDIAMRYTLRKSRFVRKLMALAFLSIASSYSFRTNLHYLKKSRRLLFLPG